MTAPASIARKVRALLRLADPARGGQPAEREVARAKAEALAAKHGLALDALAALPDDHKPGERAIRIDGPHQVWGALLLMDVAAAFGIRARITRDGASLSGEPADVDRAVRAHADAWATVLAGHDTLMATLTPAARAARRYLHARYPDPAYHADVLAHLRYWPQPRLERDVAAVLATGRARARAIARALHHAHVAPDDIAPSPDVSRAYFNAATFTLYLRLRDLQRARGRAERTEEPVSDPAPTPEPAATVPRRSRRRRAPKPPPAAAVAAGDTAGATSPIGLAGIGARET